MKTLGRFLVKEFLYLRTEKLWGFLPDCPPHAPAPKKTNVPQPVSLGTTLWEQGVGGPRPCCVMQLSPLLTASVLGTPELPLPCLSGTPCPHLYQRRGTGRSKVRSRCSFLSKETLGWAPPPWLVVRFQVDCVPFPSHWRP